MRISLEEFSTVTAAIHAAAGFRAVARGTFGCGALVHLSRTEP